MRICSAAQLHTAPLSQTIAPQAPAHDCALPLLGPRIPSSGGKGCLLSTLLENALKPSTGSIHMVPVVKFAVCRA